jgi:hypothetical protein
VDRLQASMSSQSMSSVCVALTADFLSDPVEVPTGGRSRTLMGQLSTKTVDKNPSLSNRVLQQHLHVLHPGPGPAAGKVDRTRVDRQAFLKGEWHAQRDGAVGHLCKLQ